VEGGVDEEVAGAAVQPEVCLDVAGGGEQEVEGVEGVL
jgi:hypothetical protein